MSSEWKKQLAIYFLTMLQGEKEIEYERQILGRTSDFEPYAAFQRFDRENKKYINLNNIQNFLKENLIQYSESILKEIIRLYDKDSDGVLNYEEFLKILLTNSDYDLRAFITQRETYHVGINDYLMIDIEDQITRIFKMEMNLMEDMIKKSDALKYNIGIQVREAFRRIDYLNYNFIDEDELLLFLKQQGCEVSVFEVKHLMNRIDRNCDGRVGFDDFASLFMERDNNKVRTRDENYYYETDKEYNRKEMITSCNMSTILAKGSLLPESLILKASLNSYTSPIIEEDKTLKNILTNANASNYPKENNFKSSLSQIKKEKSKTINYDNLLLNYFKKIISFEIKSQTEKESFAFNAQTHFFNIFRLFDIHQTGSVSLIDFKEALINLNIIVTSEEVQLLFKRFDENKNNNLSYSDISKLICPLREEYSTLLHNESMLHIRNGDIPEKTIKSLTDLLRFLIYVENQIELIRKVLCDKPSLKLSDAFGILKGKIKHYVIRQDIEDFILNRGVNVSNCDIGFIMNRFDKNADQRITIDEFMNELLPNSYK